MMLLLSVKPRARSGKDDDVICEPHCSSFCAFLSNGLLVQQLKFCANDYRDWTATIVPLSSVLIPQLRWASHLD